MRNDILIKKWEDLSEEVNWNISKACVLFLLALFAVFYLDYFGFMASSIIILVSSLVLYYVNYKESEKKYKLIYETWRKGLDDYRYQVALDCLYHSKDIVPYAVKSYVKGKDVILPYEVYMEESLFFR